MSAAKYKTPHYRKAKEDWRPRVATGTVKCRRAGYDCLMDDPFIGADDEWDLGHPDATCPLPMAPEHSTCNRTAGGRNGGIVTAAKRKTTIRDW